MPRRNSAAEAARRRKILKQKMREYNSAVARHGERSIHALKVSVVMAKEIANVAEADWKTMMEEQAEYRKKHNGKEDPDIAGKIASAQREYDHFMAEHERVRKILEEREKNGH